jgi:hypothetical protein
MAKRKVKKVASKANRKTSFNWTAVAAILAVALLGTVYYMNSIMVPNVNDNGGANPPPVISSSTNPIATISSSCKTSSECYITHCKNQASSCVNVTDLTGYGKNCRAISDWIVDTQDSAVCACVQNTCMLK